MASVITATTTSGLTQQADNSGVLQLASGTGNLVTVPSVTGTAMVSGNMPAFSAYRSANQSVSINTYTKCQFNTEEFDTASAYDNATNYRFTPLVAGYYQVNSSIYMSGSAYAAYNKIAIYKNGTIYKENQNGASSAIFDSAIQVNSIVYLNGSTDYIEIYGSTSIATGTIFGGSATLTYFQASLIRSA